jgi:hypothetical protein|nr:hypothetical protein [Bradyrhizobium sp.]
MGVWHLIVGWWHARQRRIDLDILWPICLKGANDLDHAKAAFAVHAYNDPAWLELGEDRIFQFIDRLERVPTGGKEL